MSIISIILLLLIGIFLLMLEILFVPGMVLGFISVILMIIGIIFSFRNYGTGTGFIVLVATGAATAAAVYWAFNSAIWKKMQVQSSMDGKANIHAEDVVKIGDSGKSISRLNPMGKAFINNIQVEVQATNGFIDQDKEIKVEKIQHNKIFVVLSE